MSSLEKWTEKPEKYLLAGYARRFLKAAIFTGFFHTVQLFGFFNFWSFQITVYTNGTKMLSDGSLEVRTHAKHMFGVLARHANFEPLLKEIVPDREIRSVQKTLDAIMNQMWSDIFEMPNSNFFVMN